jgi:hypothetical protein
MEKLLTDITDDEWVRYRWIDVTGLRDSERKFLMTGERTPEEASAAQREINDMRHPGWDAPSTPPRLSVWRRLRDALVK